VSAIVRTVESNAPNGHAPWCSLYSANSNDNNALLWACQQKNYKIIDQSFHHADEETSGDLSADDILHDWLALWSLYPTIVCAASNFGETSTKIDPPFDEYVNHKGYNTLSIGNHDDKSLLTSGASVYRNPSSPHGDRELSELCVNGEAVTALGLTKSGTSFSSPAVAGVVALLQNSYGALENRPEGCRAILLAASNRKIGGSTWWAGVGSSRKDVKVGAGAVDAEASCRIACSKVERDNTAISSGWNATGLGDDDVDSNGYSTFTYNMAAPSSALSPYDRLKSKAAIAWDSAVTDDGSYPPSSNLTIDLDLIVKDSKGQVVAGSYSYDNGYEVADFNAIPGESYQITIRRTSGTGTTYYSVAWVIEQTSWVVDRPGITGITAKFISFSRTAIKSFETLNGPATVKEGAEYPTTLSFGAPEPTPPQVLTGVNVVDLGNSSSNRYAIRLDTFTEGLTEQHFKVHINS
jgi:hypothetical protein